MAIDMEPAQRTRTEIVCPNYQMAARVARDERGHFCDKCATTTDKDGTHRHPGRK